MTTATMTGATASSLAALEAALVREGFESEAYLDSGDTWTVGVGFTRIVRDGVERPVRAGDTMAHYEAMQYLATEWKEHERLIAKHITRPLTQNQFDVLADMAFQFGAGFLVSGPGGTTGLRDAINQGAWERIDREIARWYFVRGERDAGVYTRALSRVCQWHGLPWRWIYKTVTPDSLERSPSGKILKTPFIELNTDGTVKEMVTPETALARARAFAAAEAASVPKAPAKPRVPAAPAPSPAPATKPVIVVKPPPGVVLEGEAPAPPPKSAPAAEPKKPSRPVISISDPYEPVDVKTVPVEKLPLPGIDPNAPPKPMTEAQRFWGLFWIGFGNVLQAAALRGLTFGFMPAWATYLLVDAVRDPVILGALTALTAAAVSGLLAAPAMIRAGIRRLRKGDAEATQLTY